MAPEKMAPYKNGAIHKWRGTQMAPRKKWRCGKNGARPKKLLLKIAATKCMNPRSLMINIRTGPIISALKHRKSDTSFVFSSRGQVLESKRLDISRLLACRCGPNPELNYFESNFLGCMEQESERCR